LRRKLTPAFVKDVAPAATSQIYWDTELRGFGLLVLPSAEKRYVVQYRANRRSRRMTFKSGLTLMQARKEAKKAIGTVAKGGDPLAERRKKEAEASNTLKAIAEEYFKREGHKLRSADQRKKTFERLIYPSLGTHQIDSIKRSEIVRLLDKIEDDRGPHMAQNVLAFLSRLFNWHASRNDEFRTPVRRGMARTKLKETARDRKLEDHEIQALWQAAKAAEGPFGHLVRFVLLTATRRSEAARVARDEISPSGDWLIPAARMKAKQEHLIPLSSAAKAIIDAIPKFGPHVFTTNGRCPMNNFGKVKIDLDAAMLAELRVAAERRGEDPTKITLKPWVIHDLRRTARSLMPRAGVSPDVAERCMAHVIGGTRGVYDRYEYFNEKKYAFEALAGLIERIVNPPTDNVTCLDERRFQEASRMTASVLQDLCETQARSE
jgi:integrase